MMLKLVATFLLLAAVNGQNCPSGFRRYGNSCFFFVPTRLDWFDADQYCTSLRPGYYDTHLATVESSGVQGFIEGEIRNNRDFDGRDVWVGLSKIDKSRNWLWTMTQRTPGYTNWDSWADPDGSGKCAYLSEYEDGRWDNTDCDNRKAFICEYRLFGRDNSLIEANRACPSGFTQYGKNCYYFIPSSLVWFDAEQYCTMMVPYTYKTHLVSIESAGEQDFIYNKIMGDSTLRGRQFWTGGNTVDLRKGWHWLSTQQSFSYSNWAPGEPNLSGACVQMWSDRNYAWDDAACDERPGSHGFICEVEA